MAYAEVLRVLESGGAIARDDVRRWIHSGDLMTWSAVYALAAAGWARVQPPVPIEEQIDFMRRYLLRCIEENPTPGEHLHGGYEAAWELAARIKQWRREGGRAAATLRAIALDLEKIYRRGDPSTQNRILCGVIEHAFEDPAVRPHFIDWERDPDLRDAYRLAVDWGSAHEEK